MKARLLVLVMVLGVMCVPVSADSVDLVTFAYTGIVTSLIDTNGALDSSIFIGQSFSGSYTFDPTTPDILIIRRETGAYEWNEPVLRGFTAEFSIGNYAFGLSPLAPRGAVLVKDDAPFGNQMVEDLYQASGQLIQTSGPFFPLPGGRAPDDPKAQQGLWTLVLQNATDLSVITSDALPIVPPDINLFEMNRFSFQNNTAEIDIRGFLTNLSVVPEPATLLLLGIGLLAGTALRKRFK